MTLELPLGTSRNTLITSNKLDAVKTMLYIRPTASL